MLRNSVVTAAAAARRDDITARKEGACLRLTDVRVGEREVQPDADADHRDHVEEPDNEEQLRAKQRCELRLTRGTLEEAATEMPKPTPTPIAPEPISTATAMKFKPIISSIG